MISDYSFYENTLNYHISFELRTKIWTVPFFDKILIRPKQQTFTNTHYEQSGQSQIYLHNCCWPSVYTIAVPKQLLCTLQNTETFGSYAFALHHWYHSQNCWSIQCPKRLHNDKRQYDIRENILQRTFLYREDSILLQMAAIYYMRCVLTFMWTCFQFKYFKLVVKWL